MAAHYYEVALFGDFFAKDAQQIINRFTQITESAQKILIHEIVLEPISIEVPEGESNNEPVLLRCRKDVLNEAKWELYSHLKPEPARIHPEATVRSAVYCQVLGNALSFASAIGYRQRNQFYKRGYLFRTGLLTIQMFQEERVDEKTNEPILANVESLWEVEVKSATPTRNTLETPLSSVVESILEVQRAMRGLLDLRRKDG